MSARDLGPCLYCGRSAREVHHFTACLAGETEYLDPLATVALCVGCHKAEHAAWRAVGLDTFAHPLLARTARVTWTLGRMVSPGHALAPVLRPFHGVLVVIRDDVAELIGSSR